jgi:hypothetical protein
MRDPQKAESATTGGGTGDSQALSQNPDGPMKKWLRRFLGIVTLLLLPVIMAGLGFLCGIGMQLMAVKLIWEVLCSRNRNG